MEPTAIDRVTGPDGEVLQGPLRGLASVGSEVLSPQDADATTRVLQGVIDHGTGTAARLGDAPPPARREPPRTRRMRGSADTCPSS